MALAGRGAWFMKPRQVSFRCRLAGRAFAAALAVAAGCAGAAEPVPVADLDPLAAAFRAALMPGRWDLPLAAALLPDEQALAAREAGSIPEQAGGPAIQAAEKGRLLHQSALQWVQRRSVGVARLADFIIGGGDSGWYLTVDPRGEDEYQLQFQARFR